VDDVLKVEDRYYILATSSRADDRTLVLKHGETFGVFDRYGNIEPFGLGEQGLYHEGTRHVSRLVLRLERARPLLLSSTVREDNELFTVDLTNFDMGDATVELPRDTLHALRSTFLWEGTCYERWRVTNHGRAAHRFTLELAYAADFADIFEIRGIARPRRGRLLPPRVDARSVTLSYEGLDRVTRTTEIAFSREPEELTDESARFAIALDPQASCEIGVAIACGRPASPSAYDEVLHLAGEALAGRRRRRAQVVTSDAQFNDWFNRSAADLHMMITESGHGPYPYAGVPWFSAPFGRDGIITALELLWAFPDVARGVLRYLAAAQADCTDAGSDAEPGKILHETRRGEMAALGEIPFGRYYGSVDATPLFVLLAGAYYERTGDRDLVAELWPSIERALDWIDGAGDADGDGFVEYQRRSADGLVQQGWKDSSDSVFHDTGQLADAPIALCEVQAYVFGARRGAATMAAVLGHDARAEALAAQAEQMRDAFDRAFWCEDLGTYALALDGRKRPCRVRSSNAGHCLLTGLALPARAVRIAEGLFDEAMFSGWGVRTLACSEARYNPMSYHNGSVWPHDNALIAAGLGRYGMTAMAARLLTALFGVSQFTELRRLPELFCGFPRRPRQGPTRYPVACAPQAWAAGAVFLLLQACLGLSIDAPNRRLTFSRASLPRFLERVHIKNLLIGTSSLDLLLERRPHDVSVSASRPTDDIEILVRK
jgi:glycogen debranching enzyme